MAPPVLKDTDRSRDWGFTINNPTRDDYRMVETLAGPNDYIVGQLERGAETGTPHLQMWIHWDNARTFKTMKRKLPRARLMRTTGSAQSNKEYCQKDKTRIALKDGGWNIEKGKLPAQGTRTDWQAIFSMVDEGASNSALWGAYPGDMARYSRAIKEYRRDTAKARTWATKVVVLWGPTDCGKSHEAHKMAEKFDENYGVFMCMEAGRSVWVDGAAGCDACVLDEYEGEFPFRVMLQMTDKYKCIMPVKGGVVNWAPRLIVITSNIHPSKWYTGKNRTYEGGPLQRRLETRGNYVKEMNVKYVDPESEPEPEPEPLVLDAKGWPMRQNIVEHQPEDAQPPALIDDGSMNEYVMQQMPPIMVDSDSDLEEAVC